MATRRAALAALTLGLVIVGCKTNPLLQTQPLPGTGEAESTRVAILRGMARHGWERAAEEPGAIVARLVARRHMAEVEIAYDAKSIEIRYRDSEGLLCEESQDGCSRIHRAYNRWVLQLRKDIGAEVSLATALGE